MNCYSLSILCLLLTLTAVLPAVAQTTNKAEKANNGEKTTDYVRVETRAYTIEVPAGWGVSEETRFGQREITPKSGDSGRMTAMTGAGAGKQSWEQLYQTSLFFIGRSYAGKTITPTPYTIQKTKQGYDACAWTMQDSKKTPVARYVVLKSPTGNILALSVKIPSTATPDILNQQFDHMVETAVVR